MTLAWFFSSQSMVGSLCFLENGFGRRLAVGLEQDVVIDFDLGNAGVEPDRDDDSQIVRLLLRDVTGPHRVEYAVGDPRLHGGQGEVRRETLLGVC